ncbi:MAG: 23S rRNA (uracil(1939)-C(5))-methyltransferase RlmD [Candidatus Acidiferrales bacterium]
MEVTIEKLIYGGDGLAHHDGATVFVPYVIPGEVVAIEPTERKKKFVRGRTERMVSPSPERALPPCPHFHVCGGCHYQHIPYPSQLRYKEEILRETLRRIGKIDWTAPITNHSASPLNYRNRAQWKVRETDNGASAQIGYFRAESSALVPIETCPILSPRLEETLSAIRAMIAGAALPPSLREVEAFADSTDESILLTLSFAQMPPAAANLATAIRSAMPWAASILFQTVSQSRMDLFGPGHIEYIVNGITFRVSHFSFFQVNRFLAGEMAAAVSAAAGDGALALDLFAGVGLFSLPLTNGFKRVVAVESNPVAARDCEANAAANRERSGKLEIREADSLEFLRRFREAPDCIVLDPPRAGLSPEGASRIVKLAPQRIVYVSCEPSTLARDLAAFIAGGYEIASVDFFDLFAQTFHIETLVTLQRH